MGNSNSNSQPPRVNQVPGAQPSSSNYMQNQQAYYQRQQRIANQNQQQQRPQQQNVRGSNYQQYQQPQQNFAPYYQGGGQPNQAEINRAYRQSQKQKGNEVKEETELKNFHLRVNMHRTSIKTEITDSNHLKISFKADAQTNAFVRVNTCVTEKKDDNNLPVMLYTPNRTNYICEMRLQAGMGQQCEVQFDLNYLVAFELTKAVKDYSPLIVSINYTDNGQQYAMISYGTFRKNGDGAINGAAISKQVVLINGMPFELKSIYGMEADDSNVAQGDAEGPAVVDDGEKECTVCLTEDKNTVIMPCGHFCICDECGRQLVKAKQTCPICRQNIQSLIPMKK